jgi:hypothetical protein
MTCFLSPQGKLCWQVTTRDIFISFNIHILLSWVVFKYLILSFMLPDIQPDILEIAVHHLYYFHVPCRLHPLTSVYFCGPRTIQKRFHSLKSTVLRIVAYQQYLLPEVVCDYHSFRDSNIFELLGMGEGGGGVSTGQLVHFPHRSLSRLIDIVKVKLSMCLNN